MADVEAVATEEPKAPPTKEEMRGVEHPYTDNNGWCAVCGRSEGWKAHLVKAEEKPPIKKVQTPVVETVTVNAAPSTVATAPVEKKPKAPKE